MVDVSHDSQSRARSIGNAGIRLNLLVTKTSDEIGDETFLTSFEQMIRTGNVDPHAVRRIGSDDGRVADAPARQLSERGFVFLRCRVDDVQVRHQRLRMSDDLTGTQAKFVCRFINRSDQAA